MRLPDVAPRVFEAFLRWIHRYPKDANKGIHIRSDEPDKCLSLAKIRVFGNQYAAEKLVNAAAESINLHLRYGHQRQIPAI